jgi:hypothetical protein
VGVNLVALSNVLFAFGTFKKRQRAAAVQELA